MSTSIASFSPKTFVDHSADVSLRLETMITFAQNEYWHCAQVPLLQTSSGGHQIFAKCHSLADLHISQSKMNIQMKFSFYLIQLSGNKLLIRTLVFCLKQSSVVWRQCFRYGFPNFDHQPFYLELLNIPSPIIVCKH